MQARQKRKAEIVPAALFDAAAGAGSGGTAASSGSAYMDLNTGPRRENGKIVPRHLVVCHTTDNKVIHINVEMTVRIGAIEDQIKKYVGYAVTLHQTYKNKKTVKLNPSDIAEDGMDFGYSVLVKPVSEKPTNPWYAVPRRYHEIPGVLRAAAPQPAEPAKEARSAEKGKQAEDCLLYTSPSPRDS